MVTAASNEALISIPDEPAVAYSGNALDELLIIFISIDGMRAKIGKDFLLLTFDLVFNSNENPAATY
jgi:hypothetical protein